MVRVHLFNAGGIGKKQNCGMPAGKLPPTEEFRAQAVESMLLESSIFGRHTATTEDTPGFINRKPDFTILNHFRLFPLPSLFRASPAPIRSRQSDGTEKNPFLLDSPCQKASTHRTLKY